jgi:hypothetical protein
MNDESTSPSLQDLERRQEHYRSKAFRLVIEIAFIFGVPTAAAYFGGRALDRAFDTEQTLLLVSLGVAFVLSWTVLVVRWRKLDRALKEVDRQVVDARRYRREQGLLKPLAEAQGSDITTK